MLGGGGDRSTIACGFLGLDARPFNPLLATLPRVSEMLFVEVLRRYVDTLPPEHTGWLAGIRDPAVSRVLALLHEKPDAPWTQERLADEAAMSRSSLHERFVHFIGQPSMQYLTRWRMQLAAGLLRDTKAKLVEVAFAAGEPKGRRIENTSTRRPLRITAAAC